MQPTGDALPPQARQLFIEQFERDVKFFQLFFLLINKSCPIKKIDLVWAETGPARRVGLRRLMGTADALTSSCSRLLQSNESPDPLFCNLVNGWGRHEPESCGVSDKAAAERARDSGSAQVYRCHAGLVDIAVPVVCDGEHIATLLTGQVLREPPTRAGLAQIFQDIEHLPYVDHGELAKAYWEVPVVSNEQIQNAIEVLEVFAEYLSNSWKRLWGAVREQVRRNQELQLSRKEFAELALAGETAGRPRICELMAGLGLRHFPNRVLVVKLETEEEYRIPGRSFDLAFTAALQAIEEFCDKQGNASCAYLRRRGVCVFISDRDAGQKPSSELRAQSLARQILHTIASRCDMRARVGIGGAKRAWNDLADSYHEASMALAECHDPIAVFGKRPAPLAALSISVENLSEFLLKRQWRDAAVAIRSLPVLAQEHLGSKPQGLQAQRHLYASALDSMCLTCEKLGSSNASVVQLRMAAGDRLERAAAVFELTGAFVESAESILDEARSLFASRREKIVDRACRIIDYQLSDPAAAREISIQGIASALGISTAHLSRTVKQATGLTFERYLMSKRIDFAKRLLLEPLANISEVAERCGFSDPTYFSRVFRQLAGCPPSVFRNQPG